MCVLSSQNRQNDYIMGDVPIEIPNEEKYLSVTTTCKLEVKEQCATAPTKANAKLDVVNTAIKYKINEVAIRFQFLVRRHLDYWQ